jgi:hypothetical protein
VRGRSLWSATRGHVSGSSAPYWTQCAGAPNRLLGISFVLGLPGGAPGLVAARHRLTAQRTRDASGVLTGLAFPFAITQVRSMGSITLLIMFAFGVLGRRIAHGHTHVSVAPTDPAPSTLRS